MKLKYNNKEIDLVECKTFYQRLKGFMFTKNIDKCLLFNRCNSIHTMFMKKNIDVIMCDNDNKILYIYRNVPKNKIILPRKKVHKVYELPVNYFDYQLNTYLEVRKWKLVLLVQEHMLSPYHLLC